MKLTMLTWRGRLRLKADVNGLEVRCGGQMLVHAWSEVEQLVLFKETTHVEDFHELVLRLPGRTIVFDPQHQIYWGTSNAKVSTFLRSHIPAERVVCVTSDEPSLCDIDARIEHVRREWAKERRSNLWVALVGVPMFGAMVGIALFLDEDGVDLSDGINVFLLLVGFSVMLPMVMTIMNRRFQRDMRELEEKRRQLERESAPSDAAVNEALR